MFFLLLVLSLGYANTIWYLYVNIHGTSIDGFICMHLTDTYGERERIYGQGEEGERERVNRGYL